MQSISDDFRPHAMARAEGLALGLCLWLTAVLHNRAFNGAHHPGWLAAVLLLATVIGLVLMAAAPVRLVSSICRGEPARRRGFSADRLRDAESRCRTPALALGAMAALVGYVGLPGIRQSLLRYALLPGPGSAQPLSVSAYAITAVAGTAGLVLAAKAWAPGVSAGAGLSHRLARVRLRLEEFVADPPQTEPWPVTHCDICDFKPVCEAHWEKVDHLSRVAGIHRTQIDKLMLGGIATLAALGRAPVEPPPGIPADTFAKIREQAELQLHARETGRDEYRLLQPQAGAGFALLPEPSLGDLFFDFEGNPFWDKEGSLEYLWGMIDVERNFTPLHAHDRASERAAFEQFIDLVHERLRAYPDMHVYHYASYEITALRRLMGYYGTREDELDDLLRREVFVDLLKGVRNGIRASRRGYGLKEMEAFLAFERRAEVKDGGTSIVVFEQWMLTRDDALLRQIDEYNEEDCVATMLLRDWLLKLRVEAIERLPAYAPELNPVENLWHYLRSHYWSLQVYANYEAMEGKRSNPVQAA